MTKLSTNQKKSIFGRISYFCISGTIERQERQALTILSGNTRARLISTRKLSKSRDFRGLRLVAEGEIISGQLVMNEMHFFNLKGEEIQEEPEDEA